MSEEICNSNEAKTMGTSLNYEAPKLNKHGKIASVTLTTAVGSAPDGGPMPTDIS